MKYEFVKKEISDYDGISKTVAMCPNCKLSIDENYWNDNLCKACTNYKKIVNASIKVKSLTQSSIIAAVLIFLTPFIIPGLEMGQFLIPVLVLGFAPVIILSMYQLYIHMRGIKKEHRINPLLAGYVITGNSVYYDEAVKLWSENYENLSENLVESILHNLLVYVIISSVDSPDTVIEEWASSINLDGEELFMKYIETNKELLIDSIVPSLQFGYLNTIWPYVKNLDPKLKNEFLDKIETLAKGINDGSLYEVHDQYAIEVFIDEIYTISDDLEEHFDDYPEIKKIVEEYPEPELPTSSLGMLKALTLATNEIIINKQKAEQRLQKS